ncbi:MAG TPA: hypothetical protein VK674_01975 [Candidatus Limnocylindria bacterium]|nr:hypothetical protein [Candidatus Limnocylindria bacterium]
MKEITMPVQAEQSPVPEAVVLPRRSRLGLFARGAMGLAMAASAVAIPSPGVLDDDDPTPSAPELVAVPEAAVAVMLPPTEAAETVPPPPVMPDMTEYTLPPLPENLEHDTPPVKIEIPNVPESVAGELAKNTVFIGNCSGWLIRDALGRPRAYDAARHCYDDQRRTVGPDGKLHIPRGPVLTQTGDRLDQLVTVGSADRLLLPKPIPGHTLDNAIGLFPGTTPEEVLGNERHMTVEEIRALKPNDRIYVAGWPGKQELNPLLPVLSLQIFGLSALGTKMVRDKHGNELEILWTALESSEDGAECSYGLSGAKGFADHFGGNPAEIELGGVGGLAFFSDLTGEKYGAPGDRTPEQAAEAKAYYEAIFNVDLTGIPTVCGFSVEHLTAANSELVFTTPPSAEAPQLPPIEEAPPLEEAPLTEEQIKDTDAVRKAYENFYDKTAEHVAINGWVKVRAPKDFAYLHKPSLFVDAENGRIVLGREYATGGKDDIWFTVVRPGVDYIEAFDADDVPGLEFITLQGDLTPNDENGDLPGGVRGYKDESGTVFGDWSYRGQPEGIDPEKSYTFRIVDGKLVAIANFIEPELPPEEEVPTTTTTTAVPVTTVTTATSTTTVPVPVTAIP